MEFNHNQILKYLENRGFERTKVSENTIELESDGISFHVYTDPNSDEYKYNKDTLERISLLYNIDLDILSLIIMLAYQDHT